MEEDPSESTSTDRVNSKGDKSTTEKVNSTVKQMLDRLLRIKPYIFENIAHECLPNLNCSRSSNAGNVIKKLEYKLSLPTPVFNSPFGLVEQDLCHKRTYLHRTYVNSVRLLPTTFKKYKKKKIYRNAMKNNIYPYTVLKFAELLERNPDEYFSGRYDWYYTGGNLDTFRYNDENFVMHATGKQLQNADISRCENISSCTKLTHILSKKAKALVAGNKNPEIFEIQHLNNSNLLVRRRDYISLYTYEHSGLKYRYHMNSSKVPFISCCKESLNSCDIVTSDLNKSVALWDLNVSAEKPKQILFNLRDSLKDKNWNCIRYMDEYLYILADLKEFYFLDSRQSSMRNITSYKLHSSHELCEINCSVCPSNFDNLIYFGSSHKLTAIDKRFVGENSQDGKYIVLKWTHQMTSFPLILRTTMRDNIEMIAMASPINGDVRLCENNRICLTKTGSDDNNGQSDNVVYESPCLPIKPPSIADAYRKARLEGVCLDPYTSMDQRINYCHTGIVFLNENNSTVMLTANSTGDIFSQKIINEFNEQMLNDDNLTAMKNWELNLKDIDIENQPPLSITGVVSLNPLKKIFQCKKLDIDKRDDELQPSQQYRPGKWQQPIKILHKYKDALAADILSAWDIEFNDEKDRSKIVLPPPVEEPASSEMISQWLQETTTAAVDETALSSIGINIDDILDASHAVDMETTQPNVTDAKRIQSKKRKYVKGF